MLLPLHFFCCQKKRERGGCLYHKGRVVLLLLFVSFVFFFTHLMGYTKAPLEFKSARNDMATKHNIKHII